MNAAVLYKIWLKLSGGEQEEAGEVTLYAPDYNTLTEADAVTALRAELRYDSVTGMVAWRHVVVPREAFRGFRVEVLSRWMVTA